MANRAATLYIRITKNGRDSFRKPVYQSKGRLKPQYAMVNGEPEHHKEGVYYVRFGTDDGKQPFVLVGKDPYVALDKLEEKKRWLRDRERRVIPQTPVNSKPETSKLSMDDAVEQYYKNLHSQGKDPKTIRAYKVAVEEFRNSCAKKFLSEIGRQDLIDFMGWLRKQPPKLRKDGTPRKQRRSGDPNRTYFNKVNNVVIFFSAHGINRLVLGTDGNFYGTTTYGGSHLLGNVFKITPRGVVTNLHSFNSSDGSEPEAGLIQGTDGNFYGTTYNGGGPGGYGTAFKITSAGVFTTLHFFTDDIDGRQIVPGLVQGTDGNFYGTAGGGGPLGYGTFYMMTPTGTVTVLHNFDITDGDAPNLLLLGTDGNFYGTTISGGVNGDGIVFEGTSSGTVTTLHTFTGPDGDFVFSGVTQATDGNLYGTTQLGGTKNDGTVYKLNVGLGTFVKTVPAGAKAGARVKILGTNLTGATSVTFNGTAATYTVVSATEITTAVPTGATTGTVEVTTPSGTLLSNVAFQVTP